MMGALSGALKPALSAGDVVLEVMKGLQAMAKLFERLNMVRPPSLLRSVSYADAILLHLKDPSPHSNSSARPVARPTRSSYRPSSPPPAVSHISHLKYQRSTLPRSSPLQRKGTHLERRLCRKVGKDRGDEGDAKRPRGRGLASGRASGRRRVRFSLMSTSVPQPDSFRLASHHRLANLVQLPNLLSGLLNSSAQPPEVLTQTVRILLQLSFCPSKCSFILR